MVAFRVVPHAAALATTRAIASTSPDAIRAAKRLLNLASLADAGTVFAAERDEQHRLIGSPNQIEAVKANLENRSGRFADAGPISVN